MVRKAVILGNASWRGGQQEQKRQGVDAGWRAAWARGNNGRKAGDPEEERRKVEGRGRQMGPYLLKGEFDRHADLFPAASRLQTRQKL